METEMNGNFSHYEVLMLILLGALSEDYDSDEELLEELKSCGIRTCSILPKARQELTRLLELCIESDKTDEDFFGGADANLTLEWLAGKIQAGSKE